MTALHFDATKVPPRRQIEPLADLKARLDLLSVVAGHVALKRRGLREHWGCCPFHGERTPSFKVDTHTGRYHCFGCNADGDVLDFLAAIEGLDGVGAIRRAREMVGGSAERPTPAPRPIAPMVEREAEERRELAQEIWRATGTVWPGTDPWRYLTEIRGIGRWDVDRVRFHPACPWAARTAPCIVVPVNDHETGNVVGVWRIRYALAGKVERWGLGPTKGNAVRLYHAPGPRLVVAEGVEDALAAAELTGLPAWAALSAGNMAELLLPQHHREVLILADRDANGVGQENAHKLAARLRVEGRQVAVKRPAAGKDPNDVLRARRAAP